jgi:hypothetical protein
MHTTETLGPAKPSIKGRINKHVESLLLYPCFSEESHSVEFTEMYDCDFSSAWRDIFSWVILILWLIFEYMPGCLIAWML